MTSDERAGLTKRWRELERAGWSFIVHIQNHPNELDVFAANHGSIIPMLAWQSATVMANKGEKYFFYACQVPIPVWQEQEMLRALWREGGMYYTPMRVLEAIGNPPWSEDNDGCRS